MAFLSIIIVIASILLIALVFVQNPKGGGLSSDFGAAQQIGGVKRTNDFVDKATWSLAGIIAVLSIVMTITTKTEFTKPADADQGGENTEQPATTGEQGGQNQGGQAAQ